MKAGLASYFYLTAVPSIFTDSWGFNYQVYQLTANYETDYDSPNNILMFNYELSPITVGFV